MINRTYVVVPIVGMAFFAAYYIYWQTHAPPVRATEVSRVDEFATRDGTKEAQAELAAGKLVLLESGPVVSWDAERREIARQTYGIELRRVPDSGTEAFVRYVDSFNRVMRPKIIAQHGRGVFDAIHQDAIALMESRRTSKDAKKTP